MSSLEGGEILPTEDNPPFLSIINVTAMLGVSTFVVGKYEYQKRSDEYSLVHQGPPLTSKEQAITWAKAWALREGIEIR